MRVEQFYNKNQFIIYGGDAVVSFQSYQSMIANFDKKGTLNLFEDWNYSKTTLKHLYLFLNDYKDFASDFTKKLIDKVLKSTNKKQAIQKLIDDELIFVINE